MERGTWVVVANSCRARIFALDTVDELREIGNLVHCESRLQTRELVADRPGVEPSPAGNGFNRAGEPRESPHRRMADDFAHELADHLADKGAEGAYNQLWIVAGPTFLGYVRNAISPTTMGHLKGTVDKDLTALRADKILKHLPYAL